MCVSLMVLLGKSGRDLIHWNQNDKSRFERTASNEAFNKVGFQNNNAVVMA